MRRSIPLDLTSGRGLSVAEEFIGLDAEWELRRARRECKEAEAALAL